jgi:tetratricopeptide (TPR) repeat protein
VVDALTAARLLVATGDRTGPTVRLAHEALISSWGRAREQLTADRRDLETRTIVEQQRARYAAASGSTRRQLLLRDPDLANAVDLDRRWGDELDAPMREFIAGSRRQARRRAQFTRAAAGVFALLACIAAVAAWQARQSQQRASRTFNLAIEQSDALVTKIGDELQDLAGVSKDAIRRILQVVEGELVQIAQIDPDNTRLILSRAATLSVVADNYVDLGDFTVATDRAEKCTDLARPVSEKTPSYVDAARVLARCLQALGYAKTQGGDVNSAGTAYRESIALRRRVLASAPDDAAALDDLSRGLNLYASSQLKAKTYVDARETAQESIGIAQRLVAADPNNNNYQREDVDSRNILSIALFWLGQREAGLSALKEGLDLKRSLVRGDPGNVTWLSELTDLLLQYAAAILASTPPNANAQTTASVDGMKDALAIYQEAFGDTRTLLARDPANITWQLNMISCLGNIALLQARTRDPRAPASREQALAAIAKLDRTKLNGDQRGLVDAFQTELSK